MRRIKLYTYDFTVIYSVLYYLNQGAKSSFYTNTIIHLDVELGSNDGSQIKNLILRGKDYRVMCLALDWAMDEFMEYDLVDELYKCQERLIEAWDKGTVVV